MKISSNIALNTYLKEANISITNCPHCNGQKFIKHGNYFGMQRYKCKNEDCLRTFTQKTKSGWSYSKKEFEIWQGFLQLIISGATLRQCAAKLNINTVTAFYWRRKVLHIINYPKVSMILSNKIEMHKVMIKENFKGQRVIDEEDRMVINIVSALDNTENIISEAVSRGILSINILKEKIYNRIHKNAHVFADGDRILKLVSIKHNRYKLNLQDYKRVAYNFNNCFKGWLIKFRGIATKYINTYLSWYISIYKKYNFNIIANFMCNIKLYKKCAEFSKTKLFKGYYY